jgi:hypothetical protein
VKLSPKTGRSSFTTLKEEMLDLTATGVTPFARFFARRTRAVSRQHSSQITHLTLVAETLGQPSFPHHDIEATVDCMLLWHYKNDVYYVSARHRPLALRVSPLCWSILPHLWDLTQLTILELQLACSILADELLKTLASHCKSIEGNSEVME